MIDRESIESWLGSVDVGTEPNLFPAGCGAEILNVRKRGAEDAVRCVEKTCLGVGSTPAGETYSMESTRQASSEQACALKDIKDDDGTPRDSDDFHQQNALLCASERAYGRQKRKIEDWASLMEETRSKQRHFGYVGDEEKL